MEERENDVEYWEVKKLGFKPKTIVDSLNGNICLSII
jgi:hypothetical protein